ncbi:MAG: hypothetical protein JWM78_2858 [Verrucomicrobiaceae bacterium]|nr:hypothetical protein [Verrucomicrobiaceae bacterium]
MRGNFKKAFTLLITVIAAASCDRTTSTAGSQAPFAAEATATLASANYRPALVAVIAGSYSGTCLKYPEGTPTTGSIVIDKTGTASAPGASGSLLGAMVNFTFDRKFSAGSVDKISFTTADLSTDTGLYIGLGDGSLERDNSASARQGLGVSPGLACSQSAQTPALKTKSLYAAVSSFLVTPKRTVNCAAAGVATSFNFEVAADTAKIGTEAFSLTTHLQQETVGVLPAVGSLVYSIKTDDGRDLSITLDDKGKLSLLSFKDKAGNQFGCVN